MWLGVDYYPEQWDSRFLESDLDDIAALGCYVIRIGEFAWHMMEKNEGEYDFSFFDRVISEAKRRGLKVILGTPTATIPAWLASSDPSVLSEFADGRKRTFGGRHVSCYSSQKYIDAAERIVRELVSHYKDEDAIIAWQIDNELGHEGSDLCFCENCRKGFRGFLREKYSRDIEELNDRYGTVFWSQEYDSFDEVPIPTETITTHNPSLRLDWERYRSWVIERFAAVQSRIIHEIIPGAVVMHDFPGGGLTKHVDYSAVAERIDKVAYNNYPVWGGQREPLSPDKIAFALDYIRGLKQENFWVTEQIMGAQGHDVMGYTPRPGQARMWAYQAFAHGCDGMMFFRYRGAAKGAEQFCYGIIDADNVKRERYYEVRDFFAKMKRLSDSMDAPIKCEAAIVYDFDSLASLRIQRQSFTLDAQNEMEKIHRVFYKRNIPVDVIPSDADLSGYKLVIVPNMVIEKRDFTEKIKDFVRNGGTCVLTFRTGVKNEDNNLEFGKAIPLGFSDFAGVTAIGTESLQDGQGFNLVGNYEEDRVIGSGNVFREFIEADGAEVIYRYGDKFFGDYAAVTVNEVGDGQIWYVGCGLDAETADMFYGAIIEKCGINDVISEDCIEVCFRGEGRDRVKMVINHNGYEVTYGDTVLPAYGYFTEKVGDICDGADSCMIESI